MNGGTWIKWAVVINPQGGYQVVLGEPGPLVADVARRTLEHLGRFMCPTEVVLKGTHDRVLLSVWGDSIVVVCGHPNAPLPEMRKAAQGAIESVRRVRVKPRDSHRVSS